MISRGQRILFWTLLVSSVVMSVVLLRMRERAMDRLLPLPRACRSIRRRAARRRV